VTFIVALAIAWRVPDTPPPAHAAGIAAQWAGVRAIFRHARFWWIAPLGGFGMGSFMAIQGLWAVPWMLDIEGISRAHAADRLLALGIVMMLGYLSLACSPRAWRAPESAAASVRRRVCAACARARGDRRRRSRRRSLVAAVRSRAAVNVLAFTLLTRASRAAWSRAFNTALNLLMFSASFVTQWGIGIVAEAAHARAASPMRTD